jgi:hypothetical protein
LYLSLPETAHTGYRLGNALRHQIPVMANKPYLAIQRVGGDIVTLDLQMQSTNAQSSTLCFGKRHCLPSNALSPIPSTNVHFIDIYLFF